MHKNPKAKRMSDSSGVCCSPGLSELVMWVISLAFVGAEVSLCLALGLEEASSLATDTETALELCLVSIPRPHSTKAITVVNNGEFKFSRNYLLDNFVNDLG